MTDNATDAEGVAPQRDSEDAIVFTPLTFPDRERGRRRRRILGVVAAVVVVAGGITAWAVAAHSGGGEPVKHTAVIPKAFGAYTQAKPADSQWKLIGGDRLDLSRGGEAWITYTAPGGKAAGVSVDLDPSDYTSDQGTRFGPGSDSSTESLLGVDDMSAVRDYPAGEVGGTIQCADPAVKGNTVTTCAWQSKAANVTFFPARDGKGVIDHTAAADLRTFLAALTIEPKSS